MLLHTAKQPTPATASSWTWGWCSALLAITLLTWYSFSQTRDLANLAPVATHIQFPEDIQRHKSSWCEVSSVNCLWSGRPRNPQQDPPLHPRHRPALQEAQRNAEAESEPTCTLWVQELLDKALSKYYTSSGFVIYTACNTLQKHIEGDAQLFVSRTCSWWHALTIVVEVTLGGKLKLYERKRKRGRKRKLATSGERRNGGSQTSVLFLMSTPGQQMIPPAFILPPSNHCFSLGNRLPPVLLAYGEPLWDAIHINTPFAQVWGQHTEWWLSFVHTSNRLPNINQKGKAGEAGRFFMSETVISHWSVSQHHHQSHRHKTVRTVAKQQKENTPAVSLENTAIASWVKKLAAGRRQAAELQAPTYRKPVCKSFQHYKS